MKKSMYCVLFLFSCAVVFAQKIERIKSTYIHNNKVLSLKDFQTIFISNQEATTLFKQAKTNYIVASIFGGVGGFFIGWYIGQAISNKRGAPGIFAIAGLTATGIGIPFYIGFNKNLKKAVAAYNESLDANGGELRQPLPTIAPPVSRLKLQVVGDATSVGLALNF